MTGPRPARRPGRPSPLLGVAPSSRARRRRLTLDPAVLPYLQAHRVRGRLVLPGAVAVEMALAMARALGRRTVRLLAIDFRRAVFLREGRAHALHAALAEGGPAILRVDDETADGADATPHVTVQIAAGPGGERTAVDLAEVRRRCPAPLSTARFYDDLRAGGNDYGPAFRGVARLWRGEREALAMIRVPGAAGDDVGDHHLHPVLLDACLQVALAAEQGRARRGALLLGIEELRFLRSPGAGGWAHARLRPAGVPADDTVADIRVLDDGGRLVVDLRGVRLRALAPARGDASLTVAVSATFPAEPLEESLAFWLRELDLPAAVTLAPYNQPFQQLLDPHSVLSTNRDGLNVLLVRVEDWLPRDGGVLPDPRDLTQLHDYETDYLYQEIVRDNAYLRHGVTLGDEDACVVDVGANIGVFTLLALTRCPRARVYAFEPSPEAFEALAANLAAHHDRVRLFNVGLADHDGALPFTCYHGSTLFSGYHAEASEDRAAMTAVIRNVLRSRGDVAPDAAARVAEELAGARMASTTIPTPVRTLARVIEEERLERIDLLKIDAEKSELAILRGLREADWAIVRQVVVEVHDGNGAVGRAVRELLEAHGFVVVREQHPLLRDSGLDTLYAVRPPAPASSAADAGAGAAVDGLARIADDFVAAVTAAAARSATPWLVALCPPSTSEPDDSARRARLTAIEARVASGLAGVDRLHVVTPTEIVATYPVPDPGAPDGDALGRVPYTRALYAALSSVVTRWLHALARLPYKLIVLDADDTLWKGRCGEDAPEALELDGGRGALQAFMRRQHDAGMLLALCSKNNEDDVLAVFARRPDMPLTLDHFAARRIDWGPKSERVRALAAELGIGLDAVVVVDDDPAECAEIRARCPEVLTVALPADPERIPRLLDHVWAFDHGRVTAEDLRRAAFHREDRRRQAARRASPTFAEFLASLDVRVRIAPAAPADLARVAELTRRTNQLNVTTIRRSEAEIVARLAADLECLVVGVDDRFGRYGLVGAMLFATGDDAIVVDTFLLSCRALGRGVEHRMLARLGEIALERGRGRVDVPFVPTGRNGPALAFLETLGGEVVAGPADARVVRLSACAAAAAAQRPPAEPPAPPASAADSNAVATPGPDGPSPASVLARIATELDDVGRILAAIDGRARAADAAEASDDDVERTIAEVWRDVLGVDAVGVDDNFFELGGTSVAAVLVATELERRLNREISLVTLFDRTTVGSIARLLRHGDEDALTADIAASRRRGEQRRAHATAGSTPP